MIDRLLAWWKRAASPPATARAAADPERLRRRYQSFRRLLTLNNECLELLAGLQEDLQYVPARRDVVGDRVELIYEKVEGVVDALEALTGHSYRLLRDAVQGQRAEVERHIAAQQELLNPRLSASLAEIGLAAEAEAGAKAAWLGEVKNKVKLPVPDGYVLTTEAFRQFCGIPFWQRIRDTLHAVDLNDLDRLAEISARLQRMVMEAPVPRAVEVALSERARLLDRKGRGLAVRSSAIGEGGAQTYAGQYLTLLNVPAANVVDAYKEVVAGRFSTRALSYRLSTGMLEVENPLAVLVLPMLRARAAGILYTRDPSDPRGKQLWVTATRGLGLDVASGGTPADLFIVLRSRGYPIVERSVVRKSEQLVASAGGGVERVAVADDSAGAPSLDDDYVQLLAQWGEKLEDHFRSPQDVEWVLEDDGSLWVVQTRPLAMVETRGEGKARVKADPLLEGGRTVFPGRVSGAAFLAEHTKPLSSTPEGAILFLRRASPEVVPVFSRINGLVAEWGNVTGHAAALLREFQIPSVFLMQGAFDKLAPGDEVSLDAVQAKLYRGLHFAGRPAAPALRRERGKHDDPMRSRLLRLHLLDPHASDFTPKGCRSTHDVLRYCHEKAVEAMFAVNDMVVEADQKRSLPLETSLPLHVYILDLGGGLAPLPATARKVRPEDITCRPFRAMWRGFTHPRVVWQKEMPARLSDLASVMAESLYSSHRSSRELGEKSFLLVADEYMNFNARLAYHFTLVDACVSDIPSQNYISFRFAGGGSTQQRRNLRAVFVQECLAHHGFLTDIRADLVNAWFKKAPPEQTMEKLDLLGRLIACTSQLDMFMTNRRVMEWYKEQFLAGNYDFRMAAGDNRQPAPEKGR